MPDGDLHRRLFGLTPLTTPGATTVRTAELERLIAESEADCPRSAAVFLGPVDPGAIRAKKKHGQKRQPIGRYARPFAPERREPPPSVDFNRPIVAVGWNSERFRRTEPCAAPLPAALGYTQVYKYIVSCGRDAWEVNGLPETDCRRSAVVGDLPSTGGRSLFSCA